MSYIKPDNLEVIQNFLQDAGPQGQIAQEDAIMSVPSGVHVKFTKPDLALAEMRKPGWFRKQPVRTPGEAEGGGMESRPLVNIPEIVIATKIKPVMANVQVMGRCRPMSGHEQPVCVISDSELTHGINPSALRSGIFDSALNGLAEFPKSSPTGRQAITVVAHMELVERYLFEHASAAVRRILIRGLLRSKTKKGPKRKYHK